MNPMKPMKGKWARGIEPRMFCWVIKDRMAACERPGGYARNHRKVRRLEELIWLREHGFTMIVSLLDSPHNLTLLARLGDIVAAAGVPVLVGPSRKGFIGVAGGPPRAPLPLDQREDGTLASVVWALDHGASMVRVHEVGPAVEAVRLLSAMAAATPTDPDPPVSWRPPTPVATS